MSEIGRMLAAAGFKEVRTADAVIVPLDRIEGVNIELDMKTGEYPQMNVTIDEHALRHMAERDGISVEDLVARLHDVAKSA